MVVATHAQLYFRHIILTTKTWCNQETFLSEYFWAFVENNPGFQVDLEKLQKIGFQWAMTDAGLKIVTFSGWKFVFV